MKIPQTFIIKNKKGIERKIKELLKEKTCTEEHKGLRIDEEALKLFPNFIDYLKKDKKPLDISITFHKKTETWQIRKQYKDKSIWYIGSITNYVKKKGMTSEYGYKAGIVIHGLPTKLIYRIGYHCYDTNGRVVSNKDPKRLDSIDILFP